MPRLCKVDRKVDDNASTTSSTSGLSRADRLANRQRTIQAAAQALIDVKNPTVVSSPLSAGGSPPVRRRGRSSRLSNVNEEDDESDDGDDDAHVNDDNDDQSDDDSDDDNQSDDEDNDNKNAEHAGENPYLAYRASKIARNESKLRALGLAVPSHAPSVTAAEEDLLDDTIDSIDNDRKDEDYTDHPDEDNGDDEDDNSVIDDDDDGDDDDDDDDNPLILEAKKKTADPLPFGAGE